MEEECEQMSIFDFMYERYKPKKKIRLIELFAGIGAQFKALKEITQGTDYQVESYKICEWAVPSIKAYNSIHLKDFTDYSQGKTREEMIERVKMVSLNYDNPISEKTLKSKNDSWVKNVYNNIIATHNLVNIMEVKGIDLEIVDTDKYEYIMTYSFPCQDLSKAGNRKGLEVSQSANENQTLDGIGTRSGLLWEVERILNELDYEHRPNVLLMENVPDLLEVNFVQSWRKWFNRLEEFGYETYAKVLNAKDYGIPQNRRRVFAISIKGKFAYSFPRKFDLKYKLKDLLEQNVDEKYFLSQKFLNYVTHNSNDKYDRAGIFEDSLKQTNDKGIAVSLTTRQGRGALDNYIKDKVITTGNHGLGQTTIDEKFGNKALNETLERHKIEDGDFIDAYNRNVKKDVAGTITTRVAKSNNTFVGTYDYAQSETLRPTESSRFHKGQQISGTVLASNHHNGVVVKTMAQQLCDKLIEDGKVQEGDIVKHSYTQQIMSGNKKAVEKQGEMITLTTRGDCFGIVVKNQESLFSESELALFTENGDVRRYVGSDKIDKFKEGQMATTTYPNGYGHGPRTHDESVALNTVDKPCVKTNLRIRKLTPCECCKLMGFERKDYQAMKDISMTDMQIWHCCGDSIVVSVLMGIFGELLGIDDYTERIENYVKRITEE